jgi:hypothetical protein
MFPISADLMGVKPTNQVNNYPNICTSSSRASSRHLSALSAKLIALLRLYGPSTVLMLYHLLIPVYPRPFKRTTMMLILMAATFNKLQTLGWILSTIYRWAPIERCDNRVIENRHCVYIQATDISSSKE